MQSPFPFMVAEMSETDNLKNQTKNQNYLQKPTFYVF